MLPHYYQYVDVPTRGGRTLDKCYGNIRNAYKAQLKAGLGSSDHDMVHLVPVYKQKLKREKPQVKEVREWLNDSTEALRACFECTDWKTLTDASTIDMATEVVKFCEDMIIPKKNIKIFPNSKPWVSKDIRVLLQRKQLAFKTGDLVEKRNCRMNILNIYDKVRRNMAKNWRANFAKVIPRVRGRA